MAANRRPGRAEVDEDNPVVARPHVQIGRLDIAMQIPLLVDRLQRRQHILQQPAHLVLVERFVAAQDRAQRFAFFVVHDDAGSAVRLKIPFYPYHVGMLNSRQGPGFVEKPLQSPEIIRYLPLGVMGVSLGVRMDRHPVGVAERPFDREIFLDGDPGLQMGIPRLVGHAETAGSQNGVDAILAQHAARPQRIGAVGPAAGRGGRMGGRGHRDEPMTDC